MSRRYASGITLKTLDAAPPIDRAAGRRALLASLPARSADLCVVTALCGLGAVAAWLLLRDGTVIGMDSATAFYPWYGFLGDSLRSGHIPMWNPSQFAGTPFAADPESGWTYLPAMLLFAVVSKKRGANVAATEYR